jgi:hypothetical protein
MRAKRADLDFFHPISKPNRKEKSTLEGTILQRGDSSPLRS